MAARFIPFRIFEFNIVVATSLFTEALSDAHAAMMSSDKAAAGAGQILGALMGIPILMAAGIGLLDLAALLRALRRWREATQAAVLVKSSSTIRNVGTILFRILVSLPCYQEG